MKTEILVFIEDAWLFRSDKFYLLSNNDRLIQEVHVQRWSRMDITLELWSEACRIHSSAPPSLPVASLRWKHFYLWSVVDPQNVFKIDGYVFNDKSQTPHWFSPHDGFGVQKLAHHTESSVFMEILPVEDTLHGTVAPPRKSHDSPPPILITFRYLCIDGWM